MKIKIVIVFVIVVLINNVNAQLKVIPSGNVGVGQTNPTTAKFEILSSNSEHTFRTGLGLNKPTLDVWQTEWTAGLGMRTSLMFSNGSFEIYDKTNNVSRLWIDKTNGRIGIGTTNPDEKFTITGTLNETALSTHVNHNGPWIAAQISNVNHISSKSWVVQYGGNHNFFVLGDGSVWYKNGYISSDIRFKTNIKKLTSIDKLLKLEAKTYNYISSVNSQEDNTIRSESNPRLEYGFIAQDVQKIFPDLVRSDENGYLAVNYIAFIPMFLEAIKEQQIQIEELKKELLNGNTSSHVKELDNISTPLLEQNNPNPFTEKTEIKYFVPENTNRAFIYIYNMNGLQVKEVILTNKGKSSITISGSELKAGMYLYSLIVDGKELDTKRMILTK